MNTFRMIGYMGITSFALAISANSPTVAETQADHGTVAEQSNNLVHRVSHTLAAAEQYTGSVQSGYKWGQNVPSHGNSKAVWVDVDSVDTQSGYKWGRTNHIEQTGTKWGRRNDSEQAGTKWGRRNVSEQAGTKWGRR
jgi:hypothetical protein